MSTVTGINFNLNVSNNNNIIRGYELNRYVSDYIRATQYVGDQPPYCGVMKVSPTGEGAAGRAYTYKNYYKLAGYKNPDSAMGVATSKVIYNVVYLGVDWRHYGNISGILRASYDFMKRNEGVPIPPPPDIIPLELLGFNAIARGRHVEMDWSTASEIMSDRFEIERAAMSNAGLATFAKINEVKAVGNSAKRVDYGPIYDNDVSAGQLYDYRLKYIDQGGDYEYSNTVEVMMPSDVTWLGSVNPNPAMTAEAKFSYNISQPGNVELTIVDVTGRTVKTIFTGMKDAGMSDVSVDLSDMSSGVYRIVLRSGGEVLTAPLNVVK
jgi:hypothetical protein